MYVEQVLDLCIRESSKNYILGRHTELERVKIFVNV